MKTLILGLAASAALVAVGVEKVADAHRPLPPRATAAAASRNLSSLRARADRQYAVVVRCRRELDEAVPATARLYRRSPSPAFVRWATRYWRLGATDCLRSAAILEARWNETMLCESNKVPSDGPTYWETFHPPIGFWFALQFDRLTWDSHRGGLPPISYWERLGRPPAPATQAVVAERLGYDAWPHCPQPG